MHKMNHLAIQCSNPKIDLLENAIINLQDTYEQFNNLVAHQDTHLGTKRVLFNSLGQGLRLITGTMAADDKEYYNEKINTISLDNRKIYQLERDKLTIIQSTLWTVNKTTLEMKQNQDTLTEAYKYTITN